MMGRNMMVVGILALMVAACASGQGGVRQRGRSDVITAAEIAGTTATTAYDAVQQLRPTWLSSRGRTCFSGNLYARVIVDSSPPEALTRLYDVSPEVVGQIRYLTPLEAATRFGTGFPGGAIVIQTK